MKRLRKPNFNELVNALQKLGNYILDSRVGVMYNLIMELRHEPDPRITNVDTIKRMVAFYTRKEAADYAASIGWPKGSARKVVLPFGRERWAISDDHLNIVLAADTLAVPCADCGSTGHDTGSITCPGPNEQDRLEDPNIPVAWNA